MTFIERLRMWYEYERDANAKVVGMLESVPADRRATPEYLKALSKFGHMIVARKMWLFRLGHGAAPTTLMPEVKSLAELTPLLAAVEADWQKYYVSLNDAELAREFDYTGWDKKKYRWQVEGVLTQLFGHAWYHRGQIASLVVGLGGKFVDTDFIFWPGCGRVTL